MAKQINDGETSAATSVEGGIQDACNDIDTCCICLESFSGGNVSTVTNCNHKYHLQCILEWCERSSNCPACRQQVSLNEPESQYLLEAVEYERKMKAEASRNATFQITPAELDSPSSRSTEAEERLRQYMINMGRRYNFCTAVGQSSSSNSFESRSCIAVYSTPRAPGCAVRVVSTATSVSTFVPVNSSRNSNGESSVGEQESAGTSEFQGFSLRSLSMRYRDSILRSTKSWKERLLARSNSMAL